MSGVQTCTVAPDDDGMRLDRWFGKHFPALTHGRLQKLLRTGQVRLDGGRVKAGTRVRDGQTVRVPPFSADNTRKEKSRKSQDRPSREQQEQAELLRDRVIYKDADVLAIDKPAGMAVQGGSKVRVHVDGLLDALKFGADERPRLVHRLDKDTSGVLVLARSASSARWLTRDFRDRRTRKLYLALVAGVPKPTAGIIDLPLEKLGGPGQERMAASETGKSAHTAYRVVDHAGRKVSLIACEPLTGRTHQIRAHMALGLNTHILGDGKYISDTAIPEGLPPSVHLNLHARALRLITPSGKGIEILAHPPPAMTELCAFFGLDTDLDISGFWDRV